ncbi:MAG TPA: GntR family transcriptional regulator [Candidatus Brocadiia bacterium]|nr:GntR family transcriptional regulator [Candidatus Brocadiia bacterium]
MTTTAYTFRKVAEELEAQIVQGRFKPGDAIPPIRELCGIYDVAPMTVRRALAELCASGRLVTRPGRGTFVAERCPLEAVVLVVDFRVLHEQVRRAQWDVLVGAQTACKEAEIPLITVSSNENIAKYARKTYGLLLMPAESQDREVKPWLDAAVKARLPYVCAGTDNGWDNYLRPDPNAASRLALEYLYRLGHRHVLLMPRIGLTGPTRFACVKLENAPDLRVDFQPFPTMSPKEMASEIAQSLDRALDSSSPPTALFIGPDEPAHMALDHLRERGTRVPEALSVLGYCRESFGVWNGRKITRVDNPHQKVAYRAVQELIKMGFGGGYAPGRIAVEPDFFEGETCAPAAGGPVAAE